MRTKWNGVIVRNSCGRGTDRTAIVDDETRGGLCFATHIRTHDGRVAKEREGRRFPVALCNRPRPPLEVSHAAGLAYLHPIVHYTRRDVGGAKGRRNSKVGDTGRCSRLLLSTRYHLSRPLNNYLDKHSSNFFVTPSNSGVISVGLNFTSSFIPVDTHVRVCIDFKFRVKSLIQICCKIVKWLINICYIDILDI